MPASSTELFDQLLHLIRRSGEPSATIEQRSGVSNALLKTWLTGRTKAPRIDNIVKVAGALGYHIAMVDGRMTLQPQRRQFKPPQAPRIAPQAQTEPVRTKRMPRVALWRWQ